eukprot:CAMPEP_0202900594 /NCGR_PEP_ID=MMETSP1392-20130828/11923_1 /ASSEMBLY_ACC=CAM_ASM_000868 /TAXON_ID=225041 /ORGANISM="Chlamydomonas chlamydogama, Strain SAG 11-48b" /LENGTH=58 /DNA_ID=CAMNT_0049587015 /DNA_START=117 /DNA_END=293 /DNA_ORIENTATION=+
MAKGNASNDLLQNIESTVAVVAAYAKPLVHVGFIPAVILVGMLFTKPRPSIGQLLWLS